MNTNNFNGQNGVATSAVKYNVVVRGYAEGFNTLDEVIAGVEGMMKKYPSDAIHVNGKGIRFEKIKGLEDKWSVILRDENMEMIAGFALGKIKRGLRSALAHVLGYIEVNEENEVEENEYDVIENLVDGFNKEIEEMIDGIYNETCVNAVYNAEICNDTENEYVCAFMNWDIDIEDRWYIYVEEWAGDEYLDVAMKYYNDWENRRIYDEDGICEYVGNAYGEYIEDNCCGSCLVYVKNPYYVAEDSPKNDAPCLDEIVENALESAMDDGNEYYDDKICQVGELYVSYTSPCDEFPKGCVCVVDDEGRMYGNWCNVSDSGFAVDFLVKTLEKYNKDFNRVA